MADEVVSNPVVPPSSPPGVPSATPPPAAPSPTETAAPPSPDQRIAELETQLSQFQQRDSQAEVDRALAGWVQRREAQLQAAGWQQEAAKDFARADGERAMEKWQRLQAVQERDALHRLVVAQHFAHQYDVPVERLMSAQSPQAMETMAKAVRAENAKIRELEARLARFEQGGVPAQPYDSGKGAATMSDAEFEKYAAEYDGNWTPEIRKRVQEIHARS